MTLLPAASAPAATAPLTCGGLEVTHGGGETPRGSGGDDVIHGFGRGGGGEIYLATAGGVVYHLQSMR